MFESTLNSVQPQNFSKITKKIAAGILFGAALSIALPIAHAAAVVNSVNYSVHAKMTNTGVDADAKGIVSGSLNRRGSTTDNQHLAISVTKLDPSATYQLVAFIGEDTNGTAIADLTTTKHGSASVNYI
jgi:hypothetical protein